MKATRREFAKRLGQAGIGGMLALGNCSSREGDKPLPGIGIDPPHTAGQSGLRRDKQQMKFRFSMFVDAFLGSGVPLGGDPITSFQIVPLLGVRTGTILNNCRPMVREVVKVRFTATNCGQRRIQIVPCGQPDRGRDDESSARNSVTLLPGESLEYSVFRSWDAPGEHQLTLIYEARCDRHPFARLTYPTVAVQVMAPSTPWILWARVARSHA